jgi:type II secretory pathway predicted ATPase ExeA
MYETHFGLRERPFRPIPDCQSYYPATSHEQALAQLLQAIDEDESLALLTGDPGTGKTTVGYCLLERLGERVTSAFLTNSHFHSRAGLLQAIVYDLSLPYEGRSEQELRLLLTDLLIKNCQSGKRAVLIIDEAHHLPAGLLEELRLFCNLEGSRSKAVQVVLIAQPFILETLKLPELAALAQRLMVRVRIESLGLHEAADYLVHQFRCTGGNPKTIVSDEALEVLARGTRGIARLLNQAAHQALKLSCAAGARQVDAESALEALASLGFSSALEEDKDSDSDASLQETAAAESKVGSDEMPMLCLEDGAKVENGDSTLAGRERGRSRRLFASPRRPA